jgi:hypothetical protein
MTPSERKQTALGWQTVIFSQGKYIFPRQQYQTSTCYMTLFPSIWLTHTDDSYVFVGKLVRLMDGSLAGDKGGYLPEAEPVHS